MAHGYGSRKAPGERRRQLRLNTLDAAQASFARVMRDFDRDDSANVQKHLALTRMFNTMLNYYKAQNEVDWQARLAELEAKYEELLNSR